MSSSTGALILSDMFFKLFHFNETELSTLNFLNYIQIHFIKNSRFTVTLKIPGESNTKYVLKVKCKHFFFLHNKSNINKIGIAVTPGD